MKKLASLLLCLGFCVLTLSQVPQAFKYQGVIRSSNGVPITNQSVGIRISILLGSNIGPVAYAETFSASTDELGMVNLNIGTGAPVSNTFSGIDWSGGIFYLKIEADITGGTGYQSMGAAQLMSVPYALYAGKTNTNAKFTILGTSQLNTDTALFEVKDKLGRQIFAVYEDGVMVTLSDGAKGGRGGFSVGGRQPGKRVIEDILRVTPDSVRIYINDNFLPKGGRGGFAVGGRHPAKGIHPDYLQVTPDSTRIFIQGSGKGKKNGFSVTAINNIGSDKSDFVDITPDNSFIGTEAGKSNTTGVNNIFIGNKSGYSNTLGFQNICIGNNAGYAITGNGQENIFVGTAAGYKTSTGYYNCFYGNAAGAENREGNNNVYIGEEAGREDTAGTNNVFVGSFAGVHGRSLSNSVFLGGGAGEFSNGQSNIYIGFGAGRGDYAHNETGNGMNTAIGYQSGNSILTGQDNVFIGRQTGSMVENGSSNVFIGALAGYFNTSGHDNVFIGYTAGISDKGSYKLNIASGPGSLIWGDFNYKKIVINGDSASNIANSTLFVNGSAAGISSWTQLSDERYKKNIRPIPDALKKVMALRGVNYEWIDGKRFGEGIQMGFIAQEVENTVPEVVAVNQGQYSMKYSEINALLVEAVKEQQGIINSQRSIISDQQHRLDQITDEISLLKKELLQLKLILGQNAEHGLDK